MRLTVIGCSGSYPGPDSPASCYLVEADHGGRTWRILLDLGNGALGFLQRYADPLTIDAVVVSHLHADHCMDLCGYYVMRKYHPRGPQPLLDVHAPAGAADRMARAYDLAPHPGMTEEFRFVDHVVEPFTVGPFEVSATPVEHPVAAYALRVTAGGRTLTYSGDSAACAALVEAAMDCDLFLCEASFRERTDNPPSIHLTGVQAGKHATEAGVRRLVLTHIPPWFDPEEMLAEAATSYAGPLSLARPGERFEV